MARHHKKHHNIGGGAWYSGKGSHVEHEAEEKGARHGGHVKHHKRKYGGRAMGGPKGVLASPRLDKRARGGGVGAEHVPFSSAAKGSDTKRTTKTSPTLEEGRHYKQGGEVQKKK